MEISKSYDSELFDSLHEAIQQEFVDERRAGRRHEYTHVQLIAPYAGDKLPQQVEFRHMRCRDLSVRGFSFLSPDRPSGDRLIVALGRAPFTFALAQVVRIAPAEAPWQGKLVVGCRFLRRIV